MSSMISPRVVFRCDASSQIGMGHLMRCRGLAEALVDLGVRVLMCGPSLEMKSSLDDVLFEEWLPRRWHSEQEEARFLSQLPAVKSGAWVVVDDYRAGADFQRHLYARGVKQCHFVPPSVEGVLAEVAICTNPAVLALDYSRLLTVPGGVFLAGADYAVLRQSFQKVGPARQRRELNCLLMTFGGGDDRGAVKLAASALDVPFMSSLNVIIVSGQGNPRNSSNAGLLRRLQYLNAEYVVQPENFVDLLGEADLAVMAAGTTCYEAARMGLPMLLCSIADNQVSQGAAFERLGCAKYLGEFEQLAPQALQETVMHLMSDPSQLASMSLSASRVVDGNGAKRIAAVISQQMRSSL